METWQPPWTSSSWVAARNGAEALPTVFVTGRAHRRMLELIENLRPGLVVCGSRRPGIIERMFNPNFASMLAGYAKAAVVVIPEP